MPIETVPGTELTYFLIAFDAAGRERDESGGSMRYQALQALRDGPITDVFLMSHGWMGDVPAARAQYNAWIGAMAACTADINRVRQARPGFLPLLIGLHWPSLPWGDEDLGAGAVAFGAPGAGADPIEELVAQCAATIADTEEARQALRTIVAAALDDAAPPSLPPEVVAAYRALDRETGLGSGGEAAAPGEDREPFDPERAYQQAQEEEAVSFGGSPFGGLLAPLRTLSFWKMKDLAREFGEGAAHRFLGDLQYAALGRDVHFHLMGHSFGCIVASAMLAGPRTAALDLHVDSLALVQGALSLWSYGSDIPAAPGQAGYFRRIIEERRVRGPILTTQSEFDRAVGRWYPWAAGVAGQVSYAPGALPKYGAVGAFGVRGPDVDAVDLPLAGVDTTYGFEPGKVYNLEGSRYINQGGGFAGAHGDFAKPEVAHAIWEAVRGATVPKPE
jgi:hypothetical protein